MFIDIAPSLSKLANTTSQTQPMDMEIIQPTKLKFRIFFFNEKKISSLIFKFVCFQMQYVLTQMEKQPHLSGTALLRQISILDTVYWVS